MTDEHLIEKYLDGEMNAFNTLVWRWEKPIFNFIYKYTGRREDSKDITQKVFIKVYKNLKTLQNRKKFSSWIYKIALNICRDELRKWKRENTISLNRGLKNQRSSEFNLHEILQDESNPADQQIHTAQIRKIIIEALLKIPEEQRLVIVMKEYQGLKFTEISEILQEPLNTIKSRMYYGLNSLRKVLISMNIDKEVLGYEM
ncbi:MAG: RNA polymerase sigma factor [Fidelibacterota bacterium]